MSEVNAAGYTELRTYVRNNWDIQLYGTAGATVLTLDEADPRVTVAAAGSALTYTIALAGADVDITPPVTISGSRLMSGATVVAPDEAFVEGDATLAGNDDEVTVTTTFTMPV